MVPGSCQCHAFAYHHPLNSLSEGPPCQIFKFVVFWLLRNFAPFQKLDSLSAIGPCPFEKSTFSWFPKILGFPPLAMAEEGGSQSSGGEIGDRESRNEGSGFKTENEKSNAQGD